MKRDMDLIRKIAFHIEETPAPLISSEFLIEEYDQSQIGYHCDLMHEAGLIKADDLNYVGEFTVVQIYRLTWSGHEFVDAARNETVWNSVTKHVKDTAVSVTFDGLKSLLKQAGQQVVKHGVDWIIKTDWQWIQYWPAQ